MAILKRNKISGLLVFFWQGLDSLKVYVQFYAS
jgi:hypothetical protein